MAQKTLLMILDGWGNSPDPTISRILFMTTFKSLGLNTELLKAVEKLGFETPTEVQDKVIPILLEQNTDLVALAQTSLDYCF